MADHDVVVVGAGIAGLVTACVLAQRHVRVVVLDAADEPGGCVQAQWVGGLRLDRGAESFATARPAVRELVELLGLPVEAPAASPAWVRHRGGTAPLPADTLLGIPLAPRAREARRMLGWWGANRAALDRWIPGGTLGAAGLGDLVARRMGRPVLARLVEPVVGGVYSTDPRRLAIDAVMPGLEQAVRETGSLTSAARRLRPHSPPSGSAVLGVSGGMNRLTDALVARLHSLGGDLRCGARVERIRRVGGRWQIRCTGDLGDRTTLSGEAVVVATHASAARELVRAATDGELVLPVAPAVDVLLATLVVRSGELDAAPRGTGVLVAPRVRGIAAKALTHATAKWDWLAREAGPGRHVVRLSYGRGGSTPPDGEFPDAALRDASALLGVPLGRNELDDVDLVRFTGRLVSAAPGQLGERERFVARLAGWPGLSVVGASIAGTGLAAAVASATAAGERIAAARRA